MGRDGSFGGGKRRCRGRGIGGKDGTQGLARARQPDDQQHQSRQYKQAGCAVYKQDSALLPLLAVGRDDTAGGTSFVHVRSPLGRTMLSWPAREILPELWEFWGVGHLSKARLQPHVE